MKVSRRVMSVHTTCSVEPFDEMYSTPEATARPSWLSAHRIFETRLSVYTTRFVRSWTGKSGDMLLNKIIFSAVGFCYSQYALAEYDLLYVSG